VWLIHSWIFVFINAKGIKMAYQVVDNMDEARSGVFQTETEAKAVIEEMVAEGTENETNWLMELVHATQAGGKVNMEDDKYVSRILAAPEYARRKVAFECAKERIHSSYQIIKTIDK
jgi:hypothetical protein